MIKWLNAITKPAVNSDDYFDIENAISKKVLVRVVDSEGRFCGYSFGRYFHHSDHWTIEGYLGTFVVTHWSVLNEPKN